MTGPLVSIGIPVHNAAARIRSVLEDLLRQSHTNLELIISDNASSDGTEEICRDAARMDPRIRYVRQRTNIGALPNFHAALQRAAGDLFMWAAADDQWDERYVEANVEALSQSPGLVASVSRVRMTVPPHKTERYVGTFPLAGPFRSKLRSYLREPGQNSRFYGVFRTPIIARSFVTDPFVGADWATMINAMREGDFHELDVPLMARATGGESSRMVPSRRAPLATRLRSAPVLAGFTRWLWRSVGPADFLYCLDRVVELNARFGVTAVRGR
jgi:glycosyltransferase involved in cell wall biosynthesis